MSLTTDDRQDIKRIVTEIIEPLKGDVEALSNDVKEIYGMISELQNSNGTNIPRP